MPFDWCYPSNYFYREVINELFTAGPDHAYYLSSTSAGQSVDSLCINAGFLEIAIERITGGTTRTDGLFDQCRQDLGYHGPRFNQIIDIRNLNNDEFALDDPKSILNTSTSNVRAESVSVPDPRSLLSIGPKDILMVQEGPDGTRKFVSYFQDACTLQQQTSPDSPSSILDASVNDLNGDGIPDLVVLENSGPTYFVNDSTGNMIYDKVVLKPKSRAIETYDVNRNGMMDTLIATDQGVVVQFADDYLVYSDFQTVPSGNTVDLVLYDFNGDNAADMVTVDTSGWVRFYRNQGAAATAAPVQRSSATDYKTGA